ncbi:hypothetical protein BJY01DRAFT_2166 [Aspergillus pseudoustus]|uniref:Uncharacterized protein n=1 Tax=Aspergillus pseudoustus TaxID=1810923 RepID=A0ABR4KW35_9EURO
MRATFGISVRCRKCGMADIPNFTPLQEPLDLPFPASTKQVSGDVKGIPTNVTCIKFSDKIMITISQKGRLGHWVRGLEYKYESAR